MKTDKLRVTEIQRFCMHDGPGIRTVVFLKGCPLRCKWCHNPETQENRPQLLFARTRCIGCGACAEVCPNGVQQIIPERNLLRERCTACGSCVNACPTGALSISGKEMTVGEIMAAVLEDIAFYGKEGGLTVSGGEPTFQSEGLLSLLEAAKQAGVQTCLETCGAFPADIIECLAPLTDLFLFDIKDTDAGRLRNNTGASLKMVLSNLRILDGLGAKTVLRCIMIPEVNMNTDHASALIELYRSLRGAQGVELLPYHPYGTSKDEQLGQTAPAVYSKPEKSDIYAFAELLRKADVPVKCFGSYRQ